MAKKTKLKVGDILSFRLASGMWGFAKVIARAKLGDAIEVYDYFSTNENDYTQAILAPPLFEQAIILDSYSIFWKLTDDNWKVVGKDDKFHLDPEDLAKIRYKYGVPHLYKLIDLNDVSYDDISQEEAGKYPDYSPYSNYRVLKRVDFLLNKKKGEL